MSTRILTVDGLTLARGTRQILRGVDLHVGGGELVALMGLSGSGKTTILRAVAGLEAFSGGRIDVDGLALDPAATLHAELHRKVGMVFQFHCLWDHLSAIDNVTLAPVHVYGTPLAPAAARARDLLAQLGVGHREHALPRELSGGEAQRVAIARALANRPRILLADEPTGNLDVGTSDRVFAELLEQVRGQGVAALIATHNPALARRMDRIVTLAEGRVVAVQDGE